MKLGGECVEMEGVVVQSSCKTRQEGVVDGNENKVMGRLLLFLVSLWVARHSVKLVL